MMRSLRTLDALSGDLGAAHSTHNGRFTTAYKSSSRDSEPSSGLWEQHTHAANTHTHAHMLTHREKGGIKINLIKIK